VQVTGPSLHEIALGSAPLARSDRPSIDELNALRDLEIVDVSPLSGMGRAVAPPASADHLRLPPPPRRAATGYALYVALGRALERFDHTFRLPVAASREAVAAEARMMTLLGGIHGIERDIRQEISRRTRA